MVHIFRFKCNLLSAICFNLDQSKTLLSGNGLIRQFFTWWSSDSKFIEVYNQNKAFRLYEEDDMQPFTLNLSQTSPGFYVSTV